MPRKYTGEIAALKDEYGFLIDDLDGCTRFFHAKFVRGVAFEDLRIGDRVDFIPFIGPRGRRAEDVRLIASAASSTR